MTSQSENNSCLINKLSYYMDMTPHHRELIATLEKSEKPVHANDEIFAAGDAVKNLFVVKHGWFYTHTHLPDGGRLLVRVYHAGDVIGLPALGFRHHTVNLHSVTDGVLCPFPKADLDLILERAPKITALLITLAAREEAIMVDTLRAASRMRASARIAYLLLSLHSRLKITNPNMTNRFRLPLTQNDIGDAIGLTNVSVSREMSSMAQEGLIERCDGDIILKDLTTLAQHCDFHDRHQEMDTAWFPQ